MVELVSQFFGVIGVDQTAPVNMAELIPYLLQVFVGLVLVCAVFRVFIVIAKCLVNLRRLP